MEKIKIIICEDHSLFREGVKAHLSSRDDMVFVGEAENGAQLLHMLLHTDKEKFPDVILLDINMPVMNGIEALQRLREAYPSLKVIVLTMHNEISMVSKMMSLGANSYVLKTEASDQIAKAILSVYQSDYYFNELTNLAIVQSVRNKTLVYKEQEEEMEIIAKQQEQDITEDKQEDSFMKKISTGILYGVVFGVVISIVIYFIMKIATNLGTLTN